MDKKFNIIVHLDPVIEDDKEKFSWVLWHDKGTYGEACGDGIADTAQDAFTEAINYYHSIQNGTN